MITLLKKVTESKQHLREDNCYYQLNTIQSSVHWSIWVRPCGHRVSLCGQYRVSRSFPLGQAWAPWSIRETQKGIALGVRSHWQAICCPIRCFLSFISVLLGSLIHSWRPQNPSSFCVSWKISNNFDGFWFSTLWASPFLWSVQLFFENKASYVYPGAHRATSWATLWDRNGRLGEWQQHLILLS